jgi:hypothetical protein
MENNGFKISQYACAVLQAFLLVASIFGLDYYVKLISRKIDGKHQIQ